MRKLSLALAALSSLLLAIPCQAAVLVTDGSGTILGVNGVNVNGTLYDVSLVDGTCAALFDGCDSNSKFPFTGGLFGWGNAAEALNDLRVSMFLAYGEPIPIYLINGCTQNVSGFGCHIHLPYDTSPTNPLLTVSVPVNGAAPGPAIITDPNYDTSNDGNLWAIFRLAGAPVPEPSTWTMMLLGFGAIGFTMRRRRVPAAA